MKLTSAESVRVAFNEDQILKHANESKELAVEKKCYLDLFHIHDIEDNFLIANLLPL